MKQLQKIAPLWLLLVLISGCASLPAPETNIERLAYVELSYGVILDKATLYRDEGRLSASQIESLTTAFDDYETARNLARLAITAQNQGGFDNNIIAINTILTALRTILAEVE